MSDCCSTPRLYIFTRATCQKLNLYDVELFLSQYRPQCSLFSGCLLTSAIRGLQYCSFSLNKARMIDKLRCTLFYIEYFPLINMVEAIVLQF